MESQTTTSSNEEQTTLPFGQQMKQAAAEQQAGIDAILNEIKEEIKIYHNMGYYQCGYDYWKLLSQLIDHKILPEYSDKNLKSIYHDIVFWRDKIVAAMQNEGFDISWGQDTVYFSWDHKKS
jgi:hypothetical protein